MGPRRSKAKSKRDRSWKSFCDRHSDLVAKSHLPREVLATHDRFMDLLMHGYLDHHDDPHAFTVDQLAHVEFAAFRELVYAYFAAGYSDPGLMALPHADAMELRRMYPSQFST